MSKASSSDMSSITPSLSSSEVGISGEPTNIDEISEGSEDFGIPRRDHSPKPQHNHPKVTIEPVPPLPPPVSGYPTPWFEKQDLEEYLVPLYTRGWGITFKQDRTKVALSPSRDEGVKNVTDGLHTAQLVVEYQFSDYASAITFTSAVGEIAHSEDHHPKTIAIRNAKIPTVTIVTQTDSARHPVWGEQASLWNNPKARKLRGLTRRDLRFAILVEKLYTDSYGEGRDQTRLVRPPTHRPSWQRLNTLLQKYTIGKDLSTHEIHSPHRSHDSTSPPASASSCEICGMDHPKERCPLGTPFSACPNCGGKHFLGDCPEPRARPETNLNPAAVKGA